MMTLSGGVGCVTSNKLVKFRWWSWWWCGYGNLFNRILWRKNSKISAFRRI